MVTPSPTGAPHQEELVEGDAAGNHPDTKTPASC